MKVENEVLKKDFRRKICAYDQKMEINEDKVKE